MNRSIEDRLRQAYAAKTDQLTEARLDQLAAARATDDPDEDLDRGEPTVTLPRIESTDELAARRGTRLRRWVGPGLAAAAVIAVAAGAVTLSHSRHDQTPIADGSRAPISSTQPLASASASSAPTSRPSTSESDHSGQADPLYLGTGLTGTRADIPWSQVGVGWRLIQPIENTSVYLYDPADGRYLVTDQLPNSSRILGWSPDGEHAMLQNEDELALIELDLRSGTLRTVVAGNADFASYTRPHGLAAVIYRSPGSGQPGLQRIGLDGTVQLSYDEKMNGIGVLEGPILYTPDGSAFVTGSEGGPFLIGNDGDPIRGFAAPSTGTTCVPVSLWNGSTLLERCTGTTDDRHSLYLQPLGGGPARVLLDRDGVSVSDGWLLTNSDVLLQTGGVGCGTTGYKILHPDGSLVDLRLPSGVSGPIVIVNMSGDLATMESKAACDLPSATMTDYDMVTGVTTQLLDKGATILDFPGK